MSSITDPDIPTSIYQSNVAIGSATGCRFALENKEALLVKMIVHRDNTDIRGMRLQLNNGQTLNVGKLIDSNPVCLDLTGVQVTQIMIHCGARPGPPTVKGIQIDTSKGMQQVFCKMFDQQKTQKSPLPVGSGYCAGCFGRAEEVLDAIGMAMLKVPPRM